jgi:hypothetical protein
MEDDVGISDAGGILSFCKYFQEALLRPLSIDFDNLSFYPSNPQGELLALKLEYRIGEMQLEGLLKVRFQHFFQFSFDIVYHQIVY